MTSKKVKRLRRELERLRARKFDIGERALAGFARKLGRRRLSKATGEPQWITEEIPGARPISIPSHKKVNAYTAESILDRFEQDLDFFDAQADEGMRP